MEQAVVNVKKLRQAFNMTEILFQGVLKSAFITENALCPLVLLGAPEHPAIDILCFNNKDSIFRNYYMVYLGCPTGGINDYIICSTVYIAVQRQPHAGCDCLLACPALPFF